MDVLLHHTVVAQMVKLQPRELDSKDAQRLAPVLSLAVAQMVRHQLSTKITEVVLVNSHNMDAVQTVRHLLMALCLKAVMTAVIQNSDAAQMVRPGRRVLISQDVQLQLRLHLQWRLNLLLNN